MCICVCGEMCFIVCVYVCAHKIMLNVMDWACLLLMYFYCVLNPPHVISQTSDEKSHSPAPTVPDPELPGRYEIQSSSRCMGTVSSSVSIGHQILQSRNYVTKKMQCVRYYSNIPNSQIKTSCGVDLLCSLFICCCIYCTVWI